MVRANAGLGPWDVLHQGISLRLGITMGKIGIGVGLLLLLLWVPLGERPGIGTICNAILIGVVIDISLPLLPPVTVLPLQLAQMLIGVGLIGVGSGLYLSAGMGAGPRDGVMLGLVRLTGLSIRLVRTGIELAVLLAGWLLGGSVGLGTVAFALAIGPVIQATLSVLRRLVGAPFRNN